MAGATATLRYLRTSPYKVRHVLGLIRGRDVEDARQVLELCERDAARDVLKLLQSAVANAENNHELPADELFVERAYADEGPTLKRWRPRARGRATRIRKRTSHVTIVVTRYSDEQLERRQREEAARAPAARRRPTRRRRTAPVKPAVEEPVTEERIPEEEVAEEEVAESTAGDTAGADDEADEAAEIAEAEEPADEAGEESR